MIKSWHLELSPGQYRQAKDGAPHHVHLVVKAEGQDGRRLHIDKAMLRDWREQFAQLMRDQGIAANATSRAVRGRTKVFTKDRVYRTPPSRSRALRDRVRSVVSEIHETGTIRDPARRKLIATRKSIVDGWIGIAARLDAQGEVVLPGDVRYFASNLPKVLTDREKLAVQFLKHQELQRTRNDPRVQQRTREIERTK